MASNAVCVCAPFMANSPLLSTTIVFGWVESHRGFLTGSDVPNVAVDMRRCAATGIHSGAVCLG
jgi:hypothetical protein